MRLDNEGFQIQLENKRGDHVLQVRFQLMTDRSRDDDEQEFIGYDILKTDVKLVRYRKEILVKSELNTNLYSI